MAGTNTVCSGPRGGTDICSLRIPTKSAGDSERRRPPIPIEAGRGFRLSRPPCEARSGVSVIIRSVSSVDVKLVMLGGDLSEAFAFEGEPVGVVDEAIEDGICDGGISDDFIPSVDGHLAGDDG